jgi:hypothetical protein
MSMLWLVPTHHRAIIMQTATNGVVAIYGSHSGAESAIKELQKSGFDMTQLSIIGRGYHTEEHVVGYYTASDRMKYWGSVGAFWGGFWGLLVGSAFFMIPGIGPMLMAGPVVSWIIGALEGAVVVGGLSAVGAGICSLGIPKDSALKYETALKAGKFALIVHGTDLEVDHARGVIAQSSPETIDAHVLHRAPAPAPAAGRASAP